MRCDLLVLGLVGAVCWGGAAVGSAQLPAPGPGFRPGTTSAAKDWYSVREFSVLLTEKELAGFYPVSIEGNIDAQKGMQFRAQFERIPAENFFQAQAYYGLSPAAEAEFKKTMEWRCYRQLSRDTYLDVAGNEWICSVWGTSFPQLVRTLYTCQDAERAELIVRTLCCVGRDNVEVQGVLLRTLAKNSSAAVRRAAIGCLRSMTAEPGQAVPALIRAAETDADWQVQRAAISALGSFPEHAAPAAPLLLNTLSSPHPLLRCAAAKSLANVYRQGDLHRHLQVDADDAQQQIQLFTKLLQVTVDDRLQRELLEAEQQDMQPISVAKTIQFEYLGGQQILIQGAVGMPGVVAMRNLPLGPQVRVVAVDAQARPLMAVLAPAQGVMAIGRQEVRLAEDPTEFLRKGAIENLGLLGPRAAEVVPLLLPRLRDDPSAEVRGAASVALARIAPDQREVVDAIVEGLEKDSAPREQHVEATRLLGAAAEASIPAVRELLETVRGREMRLQLVSLLGAVGANSDQGRRALLQVFVADADLEMRVAAALALERAEDAHGPRGADPVDVCLGQARKQLRSLEQFAKAEAARALGMIGPRAAESVPELMEATGHYSFSVQMAAVQALAKMGPAAKPAVPRLAELLQEQHWRLIPPVAAEALGDMGPLAQDALPALEQCLHSSHPGLRDAAAAAIEKIKR